MIAPKKTPIIHQENFEKGGHTFCTTGFNRFRGLDKSLRWSLNLT